MLHPTRRKLSPARVAALAAAALALAACKEKAPAVSQAEIERFGFERSVAVAAPPIELTDIDGFRFSLAQAKGKVVLVNFWATWCPPCRTEMPSMLALGRDLEARYPGKFKMVAVSVDEDWAPIREFFSAPPYAGSTAGAAVVLDADQSTTTAYYCAARGGCPESYKFPESYIVDKSGKLVSVVIGPREWSAPAARAYLEQLIAG